MVFADIIVDISHEKLDKSFQYIIPENMRDSIRVGMQVRIPFGLGNRVINGYVIDITDKARWEISKMKEIIEIEEKKVPIESELIQLAWFIRENYGATMNQALKTVIPVKQKVNAVENKRVVLADFYRDNQQSLQDLMTVWEKKHATARLRLMNELKEKKSLNYTYVTNQLKVSPSALRDLESQEIISVLRDAVYRNPLASLVDYEECHEKQSEPELNAEQKRVIEEIRTSEKQIHLIHGITGSGKTRVYIELIRQTIREGKQAIMMIPEISLTYQTVKRFFDVFGDRVSVINSKLSPGERYDQFERAKNGDIDIIIGPRSAVFTPFSKLGIIIIDEEHESSYKSENIPKYHARETAIYRAQIHDAKVILGSATPSIDAYYKAEKGEYELHVLQNRAAGGELAHVSVTDLREELEAGNKTIFGRRLNELILDRLQKKEQIMLFINRRGYAGFVSCRSCGEAVKCPHCDVSLTYHWDDTLSCHYCGYTIPMPKSCPACKSKYIARFGTGTEKVEEMVRKYYPSARVLRMDADTTSKKNGHEAIIKAFSNHEADILVGTQMIVKGHDFPLVTLVGIMAADLSLNASDYRASERTFELLVQAEGRAGRGQYEGEAVIQTYNPENFSIAAAAAQNYVEFYEKELLYRTLMEYPPVVQMMAILVTSEQEEEGILLCTQIRKEIENWEENFKIIGPAQANVSKIKDVYRKIIYIKHPDKNEVVRLKNHLEGKIRTEWEKIKADAAFDLNPMNGY